MKKWIAPLTLLLLTTGCQETEAVGIGEVQVTALCLLVGFVVLVFALFGAFHFVDELRGGSADSQWGCVVVLLLMSVLLAVSVIVWWGLEEAAERLLYFVRSL